MLRVVYQVDVAHKQREAFFHLYSFLSGVTGRLVDEEHAFPVEFVALRGAGVEIVPDYLRRDMDPKWAEPFKRDFFGYLDRIREEDRLWVSEGCARAHNALDASRELSLMTYTSEREGDLWEGHVVLPFFARDPSLVDLVDRASTDDLRHFAAAVRPYLEERQR